MIFSHNHTDTTFKLQKPQFKPGRAAGTEKILNNEQNLKRKVSMKQAEVDTTRRAFQLSHVITLPGSFEIEESAHGHFSAFTDYYIREKNGGTIPSI